MLDEEENLLYKDEHRTELRSQVQRLPLLCTQVSNSRF